MCAPVPVSNVRGEGEVGSGNGMRDVGWHEFGNGLWVDSLMNPVTDKVCR